MFCFCLTTITSAVVHKVIDFEKYEPPSTLVVPEHNKKSCLLADGYFWKEQVKGSS